RGNESAFRRRQGERSRKRLDSRRPRFRAPQECPRRGRRFRLRHLERSSVKDYIVEIDSDDDDIIEARLFLTASAGNVSANGVILAYFDSARARDEARAILSAFTTRAVDR